MTKAKKPAPKTKAGTALAAFKRTVGTALTNVMDAITAISRLQTQHSQQIRQLQHAMAVRDRDTIEMDKTLTEAIGGGVWRTAGGYARGIAFLSDSHLKNILDGGFAPAKTAALIRAEQARRVEDDRWAAKFGTASQRDRITALEQKLDALAQPRARRSERECKFDFSQQPPAPCMLYYGDVKLPETMVGITEKEYDLLREIQKIAEGARERELMQEFLPLYKRAQLRRHRDNLLKALKNEQAR